MMEGFTLHGSPHSQFTYKVALMLRLSDRSFAFRYVSFQKGMHRTAQFRALSPWGQVPVLQHDGLVLCQSAAILEYLAETLGTFMPADRRQKLAVREWLYWGADRLAPPVYACYGAALGRRRLLPIETEPAVEADAGRRLESALTALDAQLADRRFAVSDDATIADVACYGDVCFATLSDIDLRPWANVERWSERIAALPRFARPFELLAMEDMP